MIGCLRDDAGFYHEARFARGDLLVDQVNAPPCVDDWMTTFDGQLTHAGYFGAYRVPLAGFADPDAEFGTAEPVPLPSGPGLPGVPVYFARGASDQGHLLLGVRNFYARAPRLISYVPDDLGGLVLDGIIHPPDTNASITWWGWGDAIDMEGPVVVVGAFGDVTFTPLGRADVFRRDAGAPLGWAHHASLLPSVFHTGDQFGRSVAIADGNVSVGAPGFGDDDVGRVFIFQDPTVGFRPAPAPEVKFSVFPNPVDQQDKVLHFQPAGMPGAASFRVIAKDGRCVHEGSCQGCTGIDLPHLSPGGYMLSLCPDDARLPLRNARFTVMP